MPVTYKSLEKQLTVAREKGLKTIAFLPVGCIEQHGPFLPLETDSLIAEKFAEDLVLALDETHFWGFVFPPVHYSPTQTNSSFTGTVSVENSAFRQYVEKIAGAVMNHRFDNLVFVSGHGPADFILKEIGFWLVNRQFELQSKPVRPVITISILENSSELEARFGEKPGRHADWREFLLVYNILGQEYFTEELMQEMQGFQAAHNFGVENSAVYGVPLQFRSVEGVIGNPLPVRHGSWRVQADELWDWLITSTTQKLDETLRQFWQKYNK